MLSSEALAVGTTREVNGSLYPGTTREVSGSLYPGTTREVSDSLYPGTIREVSRCLHPGTTREVSACLHPGTTREVSGSLYPGTTRVISAVCTQSTQQTAPNGPLCTSLIISVPVLISATCVCVLTDLTPPAEGDNGATGVLCSVEPPGCLIKVSVCPSSCEPVWPSGKALGS